MPGWLAEVASRFRTRAAEVADGGSLRIGFVFGPRALGCATQRAVRIRRADGGIERRYFEDAHALAAHWIDALNASFSRAGLAACATMGAIGALLHEELAPFPVAPGPLLADLLQQRVVTGSKPLPVECWAASHDVCSVLLVLDWGLTLRKLEHGAWGGVTPIVAHCSDGANGALFTPVSVVDVHAALVASTWAHEFGHQLGLVHEGQRNPFAPRARPWIGGDDRRSPFGVMAAGQRRERGRRLEWSRASDLRWGDADHDEVAWLRSALPQLARQRFHCAGVCRGACGGARTPSAVDAAACA